MKRAIQPQASRRIEALDSFRGIASILIMVTHFILYVTEIFQVENLSMIYDWLSWKLPYFFVLSGFVLTLSYIRAQKSSSSHIYRNFIINRIFRIFPLFMLTTIAVFILKVAFSAGADLEGASRFFNISWRISPTIPDLLHSLTLIGLSDTWTFNGPAWTLVFEMRYAIIFPLFIYLLRRSWIYMLTFLCLSFMAYNVDASLERVDIFYALDFQLSNLCSMINYLAFYLAGIMLALNRDRLSSLYCSLTKQGTRMATIIAILAMLAPRWVPFIVPQGAASFANNLVILLGIALWIVILINNKAVAHIFTNKPLIALGRSSFSIYMWHTPIFILNYMLLRDHISIWFIIALSIIVTLVVARLSFRYIEQPLIALGHKLTNRSKI